MLRITNDNFNNVVEAAVKAYTKSIYNGNCFSTSEVRMEINASNELDRLAFKLKELGVDFETFIAPIYKKYKILGDDNKENDSSNLREELKKLPCSLKLEISCRTLEYLFCKEDKSLIVEGDEPAIKEAYFIQIQDDSRFAYQQWEVSEESIKELKKVKKFNNLFKQSERFAENKKLSKISIFRDLYASDDVDCSSILLKYENGEDEYFVCGAIGGFYEDVVIANDKNIIETLPLDNTSEDWRYRTLKKEAKVKIDSNTGCDYVAESSVITYDYVWKFIDMMSVYEAKLLNLA